MFRQGALRYTVNASGEFLLYRGSRQLLKTLLKDLDATVSVVWSDDDTEFAVTWSDGGAAGGFHVRAFRIDGNTVTELPAAQKAFSAFKARHWCEARGDNERAYGWLPDSHRLVLALSVYPTSDCGAEMGYTEGYVVDAATGDIQQHWGQKELNTYIRNHPESASW